jgi:hypothetical protein
MEPNPLDLMRRQRSERHRARRDDYWQHVRAVALREHTSEANAAAAAQALDAAATELELDTETVAKHVAKLAELLAIGDTDARHVELRQRQHDAHEALQAEDRRWEAALADRQKRSAAVQEAFNVANAAVASNGQARRRAAELRRELEEAGAPPATITA